MQTIYSWLQRPYFVNTHPMTNFFVCLGLGTFIFLFLYVLEPFDIELVGSDLFLYTIGFGGVTFAVAFICFLLFFRGLKTYANNDTWTVGKNIFFLAFTLFMIAFCNHWYNLISLKLFNHTRQISLSKSVVHTLIVGVFPVILYTLYTEIYFRKKREKIISNLMIDRKIHSQKKQFDQTSKTEKTSHYITLQSSNDKSILTFTIDQLIYITSESNYSSFFLASDKGVKEKILRIPLHEIMNQLSDYPQAIRCHKSFIVHANFIQRISGNARGYQIYMKHLDFTIPVSRSFSKSVLLSFSS
jgi:hypothetical protein